MKEIKSRRAVIILFLTGLLITRCGKDNPTVATIGNSSVITLEELVNNMSKGKTEGWMAQVTPLTARLYLEKMIDDQMKYMSALEKGYDADSTLLLKAEAVKKNMILSKLYEKEVIDKVIKESTIRNIYAMQGKEVLCKDIFFKFPAFADKATRDSVKSVADSVYALYKAGAKYEDLVAQFSQDSQSKRRNGLLGVIRYTRFNDEMLKTAFTMKVGQVSKPTINKMGYHILKVEKINNVERKPYKTARNEIFRVLQHNNQMVIEDLARKYWDDAKEKYQVSYDDSLLQMWSDKFKSMGSTASAIAAELARIDEKQLDTKLGSSRFGPVTLHLVKTRLENYPPNTRISLTSKNALENYLDIWVRAEVLLDIAYKKGLDRDPEIVEQCNKMLREEMIKQYTEQDIIGKIDHTDQDLRRFYRENQEKNYTIPAQKKVRELYVTNIQRANEFYKKVKSGVPLQELAGKYTERPGFRSRKGVLGYIKEDNWGKIGKVAFTMKINQISPPIELDNNGYSIIEILDAKQQNVQKFSQIKDKVKDDLIKSIRKSREDEWLNSMKEKEHVTINKEVLDREFGKSSS